MKNEGDHQQLIEQLKPMNDIERLLSNMFSIYNPKDMIGLRDALVQLPSYRLVEVNQIFLKMKSINSVHIV